MHGRIRSLTSTLVALALAATALSGCVPPAEGPRPAPELRSTLTDSGIAVVEGIEDIVPEGSIFAVTEYQLDVMEGELISGGGLMGRELDFIVPVPPEGIAFSYLIGAWLDLEETDRSRRALALMPGGLDWGYAPLISYPHAVLMLFVADNLEAAEADLPVPDDPTTLSAPRPAALIAPASAVVPALNLPAAPCSAISNAYGDLINKVFSMIRLPADFIAQGGVLGKISGFLAGLFNHAVTLAKLVVQQTIARLTEPVLRAIGQAIAIVGIVSHFSTYLLGVRLEVAGSPAAVNLDGTVGEWRARIPANARPLEQQLADCLAVLEQPPLPTIIAAGASATWAPQTPLTAAGLVYPDEVLAYATDTTTVAADLTTAVGWTTVPEENPGEVSAMGRVGVDVEIPRGEVTRLLEIMNQLIADAISSIAGKVPVLSGAIQSALAAVLAPLVNTIANQIVQAGSSFLIVGGSGTIQFTYHEPKLPFTPDPGAGPTPAPDPAPNCYLGSFGYLRGVSAVGMEREWEDFTLTVTISEKSFHVWSAGYTGDPYFGKNFYLGFSYDGYGPISITPDAASGGFRVVSPIEASRKALTPTYMYDKFSITYAYDVTGIGVGEGFIGVGFQPYQFQCLANGDLLITNVPSNMGAGLTWYARRIA